MNELYTHRTQAFPRITTDPKRTALAMFVVWGIGDTITTLAMTVVHGPGYEWNILMAWLLQAGPGPFVVVKAVGATFVATIIWTKRTDLWGNPAWVPVVEILLIMGVLAVGTNTLAALGVWV